MYYSNKVWEDKNKGNMTCMGDMKNAYTFWRETLKEKSHLKHLSEIHKNLSKRKKLRGYGMD
jgi:hypothetical protein